MLSVDDGDSAPAYDLQPMAIMDHRRGVFINA
jgi:hypothetical protein